jgi:hypothetical protein
MMGYSRDSFCDLALQEISRKKPVLKNRVLSPLNSQPHG